ncbi:hypothetical protein [Natronosalvus halobius]|uniref:hypothetical protein n=1 Tax=Natronosalvus halobius TaxID=2953746 RepID=UPI00209FC21A|nr:hypothetical protein [Natronosalvus halobius]USZ73230.1 hypothetical protein NGM15_08020 [Natronosalvus halobius]
MISDFFLSASKVAIEALRDQKTGRDIEGELNRELVGEKWCFQNYNHEEACISVESVTVRPKYFPKKERKGISSVEADQAFTKLEQERSSPTMSERLNAVLKDRWITLVRFNIQNGDLTQIRPDGLPIGYMTSSTAMRYDGYKKRKLMNPIPAIRAAETHELQSDKLEMKIRYDGSLGEYRNRLSDSVDLLKHIQTNMDGYVLQYLCELHHSIQVSDEKGFSGKSAERAQLLGEYLVGHPVDIDRFEEFIEQFKNHLETVVKDS